MAAAAVGAGEARTMPRLGFLDLALYGIGAMPYAIRNAVGLTMFFWTIVMGLPGVLASLAVGIAMIWDALIDPWVGRASDRSRSRLGRRHSFMFLGAATFGLNFVLLYGVPQALANPEGPTVWLLFAWLLVARLFWSTTNSFFQVPYLALGAELSQDYHGRTTLTAVRTACAGIASILTAGLVYVIFFPVITQGVDPKTSYAPYPTMGLAMGVLITVLGLVSTVGTLRWRPYLHQVTDAELREAPGRRGLGLVDSLRARLSTLENPSFRIIFLALLAFGFGVSILTYVLLYFLTYFARITDSGQVGLVTAGFYVAALLGVPLCLPLARRLAKRSVSLIGLATWVIVLPGLYLLIGDGRPFGTGNFPPLIVGVLLLGFAFGVSSVLMPSMVADITDEDALARGERREGTLFGMFSFADQISSALAMIAFGPLLDYFIGLVPGQAEQSAQTVERIGLVFGPIPAAFVLGGLVVVLGYRLDRRRVAEIQARLAEGRGPEPA